MNSIFCWVLAVMVVGSGNVAGFEIDNIPIELRSLARLIASLRHHFYSGCVYLLYSSEDEFFYSQNVRSSLALRVVQHELARDGVSLTALDVARPTIASAAAGPARCQRNNPLKVVLSNDAASRRFLEMASQNPWFIGTFWLLFHGGAFSSANHTSHLPSLEDFFSEVQLPFDMEFLAAQVVDEDTRSGDWMLWEMFRVMPNKPLQRMMYGRWSGALERPLMPWPGLELYARRHDLQGYEFQAVTKEGFGSNMNIAENGVVKPKGFFIGIWKMLEELNNFTTFYRIVEDGRSGGRDDATGQWSGVFGELQRGRAEIGVALLALTPERRMVAKFPFPLLQLKFRAYVRAPGNVVGWRKVLAPFDGNLWAAVVACVAATGACLAACSLVAERLHTRARSRDSSSRPRARTGGAPRQRGSDTLRAFDAPFLALYVFEMQGGACATPASAAYRLVLLTAYLTAVVVAASYSATLVASLAVREEHQPFRSLKGLLDDGTYSAGVVDQTALHYYFKLATRPEARAVFDRLMLPDAANFAPSEDLGVARACERRYALLSATVAARQAQRQAACPLAVLPLDLPNAPASFAVARNSSFFNIINYNLQRMANSGVLKRQVVQALFERPPDVEPAVVTVTLEDTAPMLAALAVGVATSLVMLLLEIIAAALKGPRPFAFNFNKLPFYMMKLRHKSWWIQWRGNR